MRFEAGAVSGYYKRFPQADRLRNSSARRAMDV